LEIKSTLINDGQIIGIGKPDSIIYITEKSIQSTNEEGILNLKHTFISLNDPELSNNPDEYPFVVNLSGNAFLPNYIVIKDHMVIEGENGMF